MCRHFPQIFAFCILIAPFRDSLAAPYVGPEELIFRAAFIAPLLLLLLIGAGIDGLRGAAVGFAVYLFGLAVLFAIGTASEAVRMHEVSNGKIAWSDACLNEAGEIGPTSSLRAEKVFVVVDQRIREFWATLRFDEKRTYPKVEFVRSSPETITPEQALVSIRLIDRPVKGAGDWRIQGYETTVSDSKRNIVAKRTNLVRVSDGCFREVEEVGIQRFLLRIVGIAPYPSTGSIAEVAATPVAYPIAAVTGPETGRYEVGKGIGVGAYTPPEWGCIFENDFRGHPTFAKCPGPDGKLVSDSGLQNRWFLHDLGHSWLIVSDPYATNHVNGGFLDRLIVEERTRVGRPYRKWFIRFPRIHETGRYAIGDVRMASDRLELVWLFNWVKDVGPNGTLGHYVKRFVMTIPLNDSLVVAQPINPQDAAR